MHHRLVAGIYPLRLSVSRSDSILHAADVLTGSATVVTPPGLIAHNPLWSPDDLLIAFTEEASGMRSLAVIRTDGSGKRTISGDLVGVAGPGSRASRSALRLRSASPDGQR